MADIFGRADQFGATLSADATKVTFNNFRKGFLVQQIQLTYSQNVTRIFELSSNSQYYVVGRPQGNVTLNRVVGPGVVGTAFINQFADACNAPSNTISFTSESGCSTGSVSTGPTYTMHNALITSMGVQVASNNMLINENFQMIFAGLEAGVATGV